MKNKMKLYCKREWTAEIPDEEIIRAVDKFARNNFYRPSYDLMNRHNVQYIATLLVKKFTEYENFPNEFTKALRERIREIIDQRIEENKNADD